MIELPDIFVKENGMPTHTDTAKIREVYQEYIQNALGDNFILTETTPIGAIMTMIVNIAEKDNNGNIQSTNKAFNIAYASGNELDNLSSIYHIYRNVGTQSKVKCTISGKPNAIVPIGIQAQDNYGRIWENKVQYVLDNSGVNSNCYFYCNNYGEISLNENELTKFLSNNTDLYTITNNNIEMNDIGRDVESDGALRNRFYLQDNINPLAPGSLKNQLYNIAGVVDVLYYINQDIEHDYIDYKGCRIQKAHNLLVILKDFIYPSQAEDIARVCQYNLIANPNLVIENTIEPTDHFERITYGNSVFYYATVTGANIYLKIRIYKAEIVNTDDLILNLKKYIIKHQYDEVNGKKLCAIGENINIYSIINLINKEYKLTFTEFKIKGDVNDEYGDTIINNRYNRIYIFNEYTMDIDIDG